MEKPNNIVILGTTWPWRGGLSAYNERLAKAFADQGREVSIFTFTLQYPSFLFPGKSQLSSDPEPENLTIFQCVNSINPLNWFSVGKKIQKLKPDLVIAKFWIPFMGPCFGTILRIAKRNGHTRVISILDNIIPHENRPGDKLFTKYFIKPVDAFVAMSQSVLKDLKTFTETKPAIYNPHPVYDNFGHSVEKIIAHDTLRLDPKGKYILFFGFIRDYKGLDLLLKAFAVSKSKDQVKVIVAGEFYTDSKPYLELIDELKLNESVILKTDFIPDEEVKLYFSACDLVVQPYKNATQSGVTQIAYHFEKPMIVTNVGGLSELVPDGKVGYVVDPQAKPIAEAIDHFFAEGNTERFEAGLKTEKLRFSWEKLCSGIDELYNSFQN